MEFEYTVKSIEEFITHICEISLPYNDKLPLGSKLLYRGQANNTWPILPKVARGKKDQCQVGLFDYERNLIEIAKYKFPSVFGGNKEPIELLALLQHYGIPTRLLDVTANPLVALYFACNKEENFDGEIIVFEKCIEHIASYPIINAIADSYRLIENADTSLKFFFDKFKQMPYAIEQRAMYELLFGNSEEGGKWVQDNCAKIMFAQAPEYLLRQKFQQGEYIVFPNKIENLENLNAQSFVNFIDEIDKKSIYHRIIIKKESKSSIIRHLNVLGINNGTLFADNIDMVCKQIEADVMRMVL